MEQEIKKGDTLEFGFQGGLIVVEVINYSPSHPILKCRSLCLEYVFDIHKSTWRKQKQIIKSIESAEAQ